MNIIIPMAGLGKRLRPHTLTTAKPLIKVCGKEIVKILCKEIVKTCNVKVDNIGFVVGNNLSKEVEKDLIEVAKSLKADGKIYYQNTPLGTAHAIWQAKDLLKSNTIIAFADTLFEAGFTMDLTQDGIIWTSKVDNPEQFGVVKKNNDGKIISFVEKPKEYVSDEAIIGIYYFKQGEQLYEEIKYLIDENITHGGEYQLTDCLERLLNQGFAFTTQTVKHWLDCGNKDAVVNTNKMLLQLNMGLNNIDATLENKNSLIVNPCYIGKNVHIENSVIGPYVSIEDNSIIKNSVIQNSIIANDCKIENIVIENSMIGNNNVIEKTAQNISLGSFNDIKL